MPYFAEKLPHSQCQECNLIYDGPYHDQNPGQQVNIITEEGEMIESFDPADEPRHNVSHGLCPDCYNRIITEARERAARKRANEEGGNESANG